MNCLVVDGNNLIYSSYFAVKKFRKTNANLTGLVFIKVIKKVLKLKNYQNVLFAFDSSGGNFRSLLLPTYKGNRVLKEKKLLKQMDYLKKALDYAGLKKLQLRNFEADDLIAGFIERSKTVNDFEFDILSRDKDFFQLLSKKINLIRYDKEGEMIIYKQEDFLRDFTFTNDRYVEYLSLVGDKSDNINGIKGIGKVAATWIIKNYSDLEDIFKQEIFDSLPKQIKNKLQGTKKILQLNRKIISLQKYIQETQVEWKTTNLSPDKIEKFEFYLRTNKLEN